MDHKFSIKGRQEVLRAFLSTMVLTETDISNGYLLRDNYPYTIAFEKPYSEALFLIENLPQEVIVSFQTLIGGASYAVIRRNTKGARIQSFCGVEEG